jgi:hypothetical protein
VLEPKIETASRQSTPIELLEQAVSDLDSALEFAEGMATLSHTVVVVSGFEKPDVPVALGRYLVGKLAGAVDIDARLSELLLAKGADRAAELNRTVIDIIGPSNEFLTDEDKNFRDSRRNAWIGEGIGHAMLAVTARRKTSCVDGTVFTLSVVHPTPTRQGLDAVCTYARDGALAVGIGEIKTTHSDGSSQLGAAAGLFAHVDAGVYGPDLRNELAAFRRALPADLARQVSDALWSTNGCYMPMIVHEEVFNHSSHRPTLARLNPPVERRRVIVVRFGAFYQFFDSVADAMRAAVREIVV